MTARTNILRVLRHHGLESAITDIEEHADRIFARPDGQALWLYVRENRWTRDPVSPAKLHPGAVVSYREPGAVMPAMQVCWFLDGRVEIDLDFAAPLGGDLASLVVHGFEVAWNWIRLRKTNQKQMAKALDRRFGKEIA